MRTPSVFGRVAIAVAVAMAIGALTAVVLADRGQAPKSDVRPRVIVSSDIGGTTPVATVAKRP
jgi:hypothetical protein